MFPIKNMCDKIIVIPTLSRNFIQKYFLNDFIELFDLDNP